MASSALRLAALAAGAAVANANACAFNGGYNYNNVPGKFSPVGTILGLRVGGSATGGAGAPVMVSGVAQPLFIDEINVATGAIVQTLVMPPTGTTLGKNLACTLSTGMFASNNWNYPGGDIAQPTYCRAALQQPGLMDPQPGDCQRLYGNPANASASKRWNKNWNVDPVGGGHGGGEYVHWFFDREGLMSTSYDGRFVTFPCYKVAAGQKFRLGQWYEPNPSIYASDALSYDDKTLATIRWDGVVDTITNLPGTQFFYGPICPDEPQYVTAAITTGNLWPTMAFFTGNSGYNGEGTMNVPFNGLAPTKSGNRITNTPGYFDYGQLGMYTNGVAPTLAAAGDAPLLFVTSPSMLNQAAESNQHQSYRGLNVGTVGGVPILPPAGVQFRPLAGFGNYSGHPFGFVFESKSSVWLADAGPGAQGGPGWPGVTATCSIGPCPPPVPVNGLYPVGSTPAGHWDKYSCTIQHWTSTGDIISGVWSWKESVIVDSQMPCYALAGRVENGVLSLYTTTSGNDYSGKQQNSKPYPSKVTPTGFEAGTDGNGGYALGPSKIYKVNTATMAVSPVLSALTNTVYRAVAIPPAQRQNYTCPAGFYGTTYDLTCSYDCCTKCVSVCGAGLVLIPTCSWASDNLCLSPSTFQTLANELTGSTKNVVKGAVTMAGVDTTTLANPAAVQVISNSITIALQASIATATGTTAPVLSVKITSIVDAVTGQKYFAGFRRLAAATATVAYSITCGSPSSVALAQSAASSPALGPAVVSVLPAQAQLANVPTSLFSSAAIQTAQVSNAASGSSSADAPSGSSSALGALVLLLLPVGAIGYYFYSKKEEEPKKGITSASASSTPNATESMESANPVARAQFAPTTAAVRAVALAAVFAVASATVCLPGGLNNNNVGPTGAFQPSGTIIALRVGDGVSPLIPNVATALFLDEINTATGAVLKTIAVPHTGTALGKNLACTLSTGMFAAPFWDFGATPFNPDFNGVAATATSPAIPAYSATFGPGVPGYTQRQGLIFDAANPATRWGVQGPIPIGSYPLHFFDREGLLADSYDGRFVTFPCYVATGQKGTAAGANIKVGSTFNNPCCKTSPVPADCKVCPVESASYDDKSIAMLRWDGVIETITRLPGTDFFYGPVIPDEPQYITSAITTGQLWPYVSYFAGNSGDNGEGTMNIPFNSLAPTKSGNRISTKPGYYDYGMLEFYASIGEPPTSTTTAEPPLLFVTSPSMLNAGAVNTQHSDIKGISVGTVGGVPLLPPAGVQFQQLQGFQNYSGHPFGFWFESQSSVWLADAGLGLFDKTSCEIQHWVSKKDILTGTWSKAGASIVVDTATPCFSLAGRMENKVPTLYTTTSTATSSKIYKIAAGVVSTVVSAGANQVYRAVALTPQPRANYTCPIGQYGTTYDLACSYDCCEPCTTSCPVGQKIVPVCSFDSDNLCISADSYSTLVAAVQAKANGGGRRLMLAATDGEVAAALEEGEEAGKPSAEDASLILRVARALGLAQ